MNTHASAQAKPFIKWVGGKTQLLNEIRDSMPDDLPNRHDITYVEPFIGGGATLFWIMQEFPNITRAVINDINAELICTYMVIKNDVEALIEKLSRLQEQYIPLDDAARKEFDLARRDAFNKKCSTDVETAALFIFLNRTCFNGLYRVNSKGEFNVPHGKYSAPKICDAETMRADSAVLQKVEILQGDFAQTGKFAGKNTLFYFDPPYRPLTATSAFTSYSKEGFNDAEQTRLHDFCRQVSERGAVFVASNSDPKNSDSTDDFFDSLYKGYAIKRVNAARMINSKGNARGQIFEIMISNVMREKQ